MDHPSFSATPADGHTYVNPNGSGVFLGACTGSSLRFPCNNKLIGAYDFADGFGPGPEADGPEDDNGHGSHTGSTAGGNTLVFPAISGVAPHANLITYDCCYTDAAGQGLCPTSATTMGVNQAIMNGVDVISYSISGGNDPWNDGDLTFLSAVNAGIFASASAGHLGPTAGTSGHDGPWMMATAAVTHDRVTHQNQLTGMSGGTSPPANITGSSLTLTLHTDTIVLAANYSNGDPNPEQCLHPFPAGTWTSNEIVLCDRGTISRVLKGQNVLAGGAGGLILANITGGSTTIEILKPDVANPGVNVFAALNNKALDDIPTSQVFNGVPYGLLSGTSMAAPHTTGSAALLRALHPDWSPPEVKSALMTTAKTTSLFKENGTTPADPFDVGAGRVDLTKAARAGLVLDETGARFTAANPATGGDPKKLNLASMADGSCNGTCGWFRTAEDAAGTGVIWTVTTSGLSGFNVNPSQFTFPPTFSSGEGAPATQLLCIQAKSNGTLPVGTWAFGTVTLTPDDTGIPAAHFPVAINPSGTRNGISLADFESGTFCEWSSTVGAL